MFSSKNVKQHLRKVKSVSPAIVLALFFVMGILLVAYSIAFWPYRASQAPRGLTPEKEVSYYVFEQELVPKKMLKENVLILQRSIVIIQEEDIIFEKNGVEGKFWTVVPTRMKYTSYEYMAYNGLKPTQKTEYPWSYIVFMGTGMLAQITLFGFFIFLIFSQYREVNELKGMGKFRARAFGGTKVTFKDVAGIDEAVEEVGRIVKYIKHPKSYGAVGAKIPRGILFHGPPGTGKTLLARAVAFEAGIPIFAMSGSEFIEMLVGVGAARARSMFEAAIEAAPSLIVIDELDSAAPKRTGAGLSSDKEYVGLVNQLLSLLDRIEKEDIPVFVIGVTNRPDIIDPALLRAGRFDHHIELSLPNAEGREAILKVHCRKKPIAEDIDFERLKKETEGFSGASLATLVNEAALRAGEAGQKTITLDDFIASIDRVLMGPERKLIFAPGEKEMIAAHEAGHALANTLLKETDPVQMVSILPRGRFLGYTRYLPDRERYILTNARIADRIKVFLAGRAAEEICFPVVGAGAADDIEKATSLIRNLVCVYGMGKIGPIHFGSGDEPFWASAQKWGDGTVRLVDEEIIEISKVCYQEVKELLERNGKKLDLVREALISRNRLTGHDLIELIK